MSNVRLVIRDAEREIHAIRDAEFAECVVAASRGAGNDRGIGLGAGSIRHHKRVEQPVLEASVKHWTRLPTSDRTWSRSAPTGGALERFLAPAGETDDASETDDLPF